jgi:HD-GYP domain-containing protein (c-di-GMP phosphodiesterase class II)
LQAELHRLNHQLEELVRQKTRALQVQYEYVANMTQMSDPAAIIKAFMSAIRELTRLNQLTLWLSPQVDGQFSCHYPLESEHPKFQAKTCPAGVIAKLLADKQLWLLAETADSGLSDFDKSLFNGIPCMAVPLQSKRGILGILNLAGEQVVLDKDHLEALTGMTDVTATALENHWHREAFDDAQDAIITALAKLSEYRDPETGAHLLRLKKYSALICRHLAKTEKFRDIVTAEFTQDLVRSSPLHDIGKVGIPDAILKKPGKLTVEEFEIMKTHAQIGGDTLRTVYEQYPSQSFIKCGMEIAYGHHEKWNGSGYPCGLQGETIPLAARILALVDVYDALTSRRVYKPPFPRDQANAVIVEGNGNHFDPDIVAAFLNNETEFHRIAEQYADTV